METEVYAGRSSYRNHLVAFAFAGVFALMGFLMLFDPEGATAGGVILAAGIGIAAIPVFKVFGSAYAVTSERASSRIGIISRRISEVEIEDIRNVKVDQGMIQRVLGIGDVGISTAGQSGMEITFLGVRQPASIAELIRTQRKANPTD